MYRWDGSAWHQDWKITEVSTVISQSFDVAYQQLSGNALFVYCDDSTGNNQVKYIRRVNGVWDATPGTAIGTATATKSWVKLVPQPNSENILVGYISTDANSNVGGFIWDGTTFSMESNSEIVDNAGTPASGHTDEPMSLAWETSSGDPMIMWGNNAKDITYRRFVSGAWTTESTIGTNSYAANVNWISAASDDTPGSNNIAISSMNTGAAGAVGCDFAIWNGSSWTKGSTTTCQNDTFERSINVAWEHATGKAMWVYVSSAADTQLTYRTWTSGGGFSTATTIPGSVTNQIRSVELYSDLNTVGIICLFTTVTSSTDVGVLDTEWDGT